MTVSASLRFSAACPVENGDARSLQSDGCIRSDQIAPRNIVPAPFQAQRQPAHADSADADKMDFSPDYVFHVSFICLKSDFFVKKRKKIHFFKNFFKNTLENCQNI